MRIFHRAPFLEVPPPSIASIGNFDGLHRGHQALLQKLKQVAEKQNCVTSVVLFEPQPLEFFQKDMLAPSRLQSFREKASGLRELGVDQIFCLPFDAQLTNYSPETFLEFLSRVLNIQGVVVGEDFRFGRNRQGDMAFLHAYASASAFYVEALPSVLNHSERVSSTAIRQLLAKGEFEEASCLLGRSYTISGKISHGMKRGRLLGFPTANIVLGRKNPVLKGVYAVRAKLTTGEEYNGVANLGVRPTITDGKQHVLEVHLFSDGALDLYGKVLQVEFIKKIRDEKKFDSVEALKAQIEKDVAEAKMF